MQYDPIEKRIRRTIYLLSFLAILFFTLSVFLALMFWFIRVEPARLEQERVYQERIDNLYLMKDVIE